MKIAYLLYDGITWLDFIGFYDPMSRLRSMGFLPELEWECCALSEMVKDSFGLCLQVDRIQPDLSAYDVLYVPGGLGTRSLQHDPVFMDWLRTAAPLSWKLSVCTGSLLLGAAGFLKGRRATTHFDEYEALRPYCGLVVKDRIVEDQGVITAGAVATSLDLGLYCCRKWAGDTAAERIRERMAYRGS